MAIGEDDHLYLAGARGIEPRFQVLETRVLAVVLCPYTCTEPLYQIPLVCATNTRKNKLAINHKHLLYCR